MVVYGYCYQADKELFVITCSVWRQRQYIPVCERYVSFNAAKYQLGVAHEVSICVRSFLTLDGMC